MSRIFPLVGVLAVLTASANAQTANPHRNDKPVFVVYYGDDLKAMCDYQVYAGQEEEAAWNNIMKRAKCHTYIIASAEAAADVNGVSIPTGTPTLAVIESVRAWIQHHSELETHDVTAQKILEMALQELYPARKGN
jgi:hypothetical protein